MSKKQYKILFSFNNILCLHMLKSVSCSGVLSIPWSRTWHLWATSRALRTCSHLSCARYGWHDLWTTSSSSPAWWKCLREHRRRLRLWREPPGSTRGTAFRLIVSTTVTKFARKWDGHLGGRRAGYRRHLALILVKTILTYNTPKKTKTKRTFVILSSNWSVLFKLA